MGKVLKSFEFKSAVRAKHDWDTWLDGRIHQLDKEDFGDAKLITMASLARSAARKRGLCVHLATDSEANTVTIQAYEPDDGLSKEARAAKWLAESAERQEAREQEAALKAQQDAKDGKEDDQEQPTNQGKKGGRKGKKQ